MRKIPLNQICMVGLFTQREPSYWSCWHRRDCPALAAGVQGAVQRLCSPSCQRLNVSQPCGHQGRHCCPCGQGAKQGKHLYVVSQKKAFLGNTVEQSRRWICGWDHNCLYLHFQAIVLSWDHWVLCCTMCSLTYVFKRKRWKHNGYRGLDF